jgi:HK97 family phage portal protein
VDRIGIETRAIGGVPWQPWRNPYWKFNIGGPTHPSRETQGQDSVLSLGACYSAIRFIADQIASLPIKVYRGLPDGTSQRIYTTSLLGSPIAGGGPQVSGTMYDWMFTGSTSALLHGNAWGLITNRGGIPGSDGLGLPTGVAWLPPDRMSVQDDEQQPENPMRARIYYNGHLMERQELIQLKAFSIAGRVEGVSPLKAFSLLWGQGLDALKYSADWFGNGGFPPGTFQNVSEEVNDQQAKQIRQRLTDTIRMRQPLVYGRDWDYKALTVPQNEAAFIQAMQLNATQIAAIYGVQPYRVGGTRNDGLTYSNVTMNLLDELITTLRPWLTRWEHLLTTLLPATQYVKFDVDDLLKMDPHTRTEVYQIQRNIGTRTVNEIRADDDKPPISGGNEPIPLPVLQRMVATTRTIPKSYIPQVEMEAQLIADLILKMEQDNPEMVNPMTAGKPPLTASPEQYLAKLITQVRSGQMFGPPDGEVVGSDRKSAVTMLQTYGRLGHLTAEQVTEKIAAVSAARTTGELAQLFEGLPHLTDGMAPSVPRRSDFGPAEYRASDTDRDHARELLAVHATAGRLRGHECDERSRKASEAVTCGDLDTLFADLPVVEQAASRREEDRSGDGEPLFGPAALTLLRSRAENFIPAAKAAMNGKAH